MLVPDGRGQVDIARTTGQVLDVLRPDGIEPGQIESGPIESAVNQVRRRDRLRSGIVGHTLNDTQHTHG
jgi:hypothetical protein